jgi:signal transduction histidine kinase
MSALLLVCLGFYLLMSITVFKSDKTQLVYDFNKSQVSNISQEIETQLKGVSNTLNLFAQLPLDLQEKMTANLYANHSQIVTLLMYDMSSQELQKTITDKAYFETYGFDQTSFMDQVKNSSIPFTDIIKNGEAIWPSSFKEFPPLISYGKRVILVDQNNNPVDQRILIAFIKIDSIINSISHLNLSEIQISNSKGEILVIKNAKELANKPSSNNDPLYLSALNSKVKMSVSRIEDNKDSWLTAYAKGFKNQIIVTARTPEKEAFKIVKSLTIRTLLFGSIVLTLVIIAAFLLSQSLTKNIELLSQRMSKVSKGDLTSLIELKGKDETVSLADSFNKMIIDLKQSRDELEILNKELDSKVKLRTKQLEEQNRKVVEAQEALLRTTRLASMGEVAGRTAHEVLNPLTSLLTRINLTQKRVEINYKESLDLLQEISSAWQSDYKEGGFDFLINSWKKTSTINPQINLFNEDIDNILKIKANLNDQAHEISKDINFIKDEGNRIGKIIHSMRRLGNMKSSLSNYSIHPLIEESGQIMKDLFDQQRFQIETELNAEYDLVKLDRDEFIQSMTNLMRNSLQSMIEKNNSTDNFKGLLKITTKIEKDKLQIDIEDNGLGIEEKNRAHLFESQFTTKSKEEGTGIGLSISRRFIRNYEGELFFVPQPQCTLFRIQLPLIKNQSSRKAAA